MSKWILVVMLGSVAFACERERSTEEAGGEVGAERQGLERDLREDARGAEGDVRRDTGEAEGDVRRGAGDAGQEVEEFGRDVGEGARDVGEDVGEGARDVGEDVKEGAQDVGGDVKEGAQDVGEDVEREWNERTRTPAGPTAQGQSGARDREVVQDVRQKLMDADLSLAAENVQIMSEGGKLTLRGNVASAEERAAVERLARSAAGVTEVDNQLEVGAP